MSMSELFDFSGMGSHLLWVSIRILRFGMGFDGWNPQICSPKPPNPQIGSPKPPSSSSIGSLTTRFVDLKSRVEKHRFTKKAKKSACSCIV
ncbi:hypothetical protein ACS0TY_034920 [Phlomoides rotata]